MQEPTLKDFLSVCSPSILKQWKLELASGVQHNMSELGAKTSVSFQGAQIVGAVIAMLSMNWWIEEALKDKEPELRNVANDIIGAAKERDAQHEEEKPKKKYTKSKPLKAKQGPLSKEEHKARLAEVLEMNKAMKKKVEDD